MNGAEKLANTLSYKVERIRQETQAKMLAETRRLELELERQKHELEMEKIRREAAEHRIKAQPVHPDHPKPLPEFCIWKKFTAHRLLSNQINLDGVLKRLAPFSKDQIKRMLSINQNQEMEKLIEKLDLWKDYLIVENWSDETIKKIRLDCKKFGKINLKRLKNKLPGIVDNILPLFQFEPEDKIKGKGKAKAMDIDTEPGPSRRQPSLGTEDDEISISSD